MEIKKLINDIRNAQAQIYNEALTDLSAALDRSETLKEDLLALADEVAEIECMAIAAKMREADLATRRKRLEASAVTLRNVILQAMTVHDFDSIPGPAATLSVKKTKPGIIIENEALIPSVYFNPQPPKINKKAVNDHFKETGEVIDGCGLTSGKISLAIRVK